MGLERKVCIVFGFRPELQLDQSWGVGGHISSWQFGHQLDLGLGDPSVPLLQPTLL